MPDRALRVAPLASPLSLSSLELALLAPWRFVLSTWFGIALED